MDPKPHDNIEVVHKESLSGTPQQYQRTASLDQNIDGKSVLPYPQS
jgi:hypothetical protein